MAGPDANLSKYDNAGALFDFVSTQMPPGGGGSLSKQVYLRIVVFLLVQNGFVSPSTQISSDRLDTIKLQK